MKNSFMKKLLSKDTRTYIFMSVREYEQKIKLRFTENEQEK